MPNRKLGKASDHRNAMLRNLTTALLWNGKIVTTEARAKEIRPIAEKLITLAVSEYKNTVTVEKETRNEKQQIVKVEKTNDMPSKLHARRQMMAYLYNTPLPKKDKESKSEYAECAKQTVPRNRAQVRWTQGRLHPHLQAGTPSRRRYRDGSYRACLIK